MQIDLSEKIEQHFRRAEQLAEEASNDGGEETYSSRASAMTALTAILDKLIKQQEAVWNMQRQQKVEQALIESVLEFLDEEQITKFLEKIDNLYVG